MLQLVFDRAAIKHNIAAVKKRAGKAVIYAVLAADGYGAGLIELATLLRDDGISHFAITDVGDARALRKAGFVEEELLMLRSTGDPQELNELLDLNVVCTIGSHETGSALNALAQQRSTIAVAHVQIDTGLGLGGFLPDEGDKLQGIYHTLSNVAITGTYTQLHPAGDVSGQLGLFRSTLDALHAAGLETGVTHAAGSYALLRTQGVQLDAVRIGPAFLGLSRRRGDGLKSTCRGEATLDTVRWLPKGHTVGSGKPFHLPRPTRVGVLSLGAQNGWGIQPQPSGGFWRWLRQRRRHKARSVTYMGQKVKVLGGIGMTETAIDVTGLKCGAGDVVCFDIDPRFARGMQRVYR